MLVTDPEGITDTRASEATYGFLVFQQRGSSSSRRVTHTYGASEITAGRAAARLRNSFAILRS